MNAITPAVHPNAGDPVPSVLSISWYIANGDDSGTLSGEGVSTAFVNAVSAAFQDAAVMGVTILVASGDTGSDSKKKDGKAHVQYPGSDPWVTSCGGTTIGNIVGARSAKSRGMTLRCGGNQAASGGGISDFFDLPTWQGNAGIPLSLNSGSRKGRGVPDIAGNASAASGGYTVWFNGVKSSYGARALPPRCMPG